MGLDFTNIQDSDGAAIYILHHPSFTETRQFEQLQKDIAASRPDDQVILLDVNDTQGEQVRDFYDIMPETLPLVMVIADDDSILYQWSGDAIPAADVICSQLSRTDG
ncbi:hypothetical protein KA021_00385 [Candidatus Saccharibacteria bacterium]|nr:hypothetical protein [Candidatus Saccharibacteria bacterium]